jgi:excisionase family DNA binding protein
MLKVMKMSIGRDQGVLPTMLTDSDVARALMISKSTLRRIIARKEIKFTYSGKRRRYLPEHVVEYLKTQEVDGCPSQPRERAKSTDTGSPNARGARCGTGPGLTPKLDKLAEYRWAQMILNPPASRSRDGSQRTRSPEMQTRGK